MIKFEFPDNSELFLPVNTPNQNDLIQIHLENGEITKYIVESVIYNFRNINGMLFGSGDSTICVKLNYLENF